MKRTLFNSVSLVFLLLAGCVMFSCSTAGVVFDDSVPPEQSAKILFVYFKLKSYNGINISVSERMLKAQIITFPAGQTEFSGDVAWGDQRGNTKYIFRAKDTIFSCRLEAGEDYWAVVAAKLSDDEEKYIWGINLYKDEIRVKVGFPPEDKLVAFIPFDPPIISNLF